jgi:hypothetical protein
MDSLDPDQAEAKRHQSRKASPDRINKKQLSDLTKILKSQDKDMGDNIMLFACGKSWKSDGLSLKDIPKDKYEFIIKRLEKRTQEET